MAEFVRPAMPSRQEGHAAHLQGQDDALAGLAVEDNPWPRRSPLGACWRRGYAYGQQIRLQREFGDPPAV